MVDVKEAARIAVSFLKEIANIQVTNVAIEEVDSYGNEWLITVGYTPPSTTLVQLSGVERRVYRIVTISRETGEVTSMKIREDATEKSD